MKEDILESLGLTAGEAKVYLSLLKLGSSTTGPIAKESGVSASKVYKVLDRLEVKGLVGRVVKGKIQYFDAVEPRRVMEYVDKQEQELARKRERLEQLMPELELLRKHADESQAVLFEGFRAVRNQLMQILDDLKAGEEYSVLSATYGQTRGAQAFFTDFHAERKKKGIRVRMLATQDAQAGVQKNLDTKDALRVLPPYFTTNMLIYFYKETSFLVLFLKEPVGILIRGEEARKGFQAYFDALWNISK